MGLFLYYLPGKQVGALTRDDIRAAGLADVLCDCLESQLAFQRRLIVNQVHARGPDGSSGVILTTQPALGQEIPHKLGYYPAEQTWSAVRGQGSGVRHQAESLLTPDSCPLSPAYYLGYDNTHKPTPEFLARPELVSGYEHELGDGRYWTCPTIRHYGRSPNLPRTMGLDAEGVFGMRVLPAFEWAWQLSGEIWERVFVAPNLPWPDAFRLAVGALSLNYRIGPHEASALGLVTTSNFQSIFDAAIDWPKVSELLAEPDTPETVKKNAAESLPAPASTSPGPPDG